MGDPYADGANAATNPFYQSALTWLRQLLARVDDEIRESGVDLVMRHLKWPARRSSNYLNLFDCDTSMLAIQTRFIPPLERTAMPQKLAAECRALGAFVGH